MACRLGVLLSEGGVSRPLPTTSARELHTLLITCTIYWESIDTECTRWMRISTDFVQFPSILPIRYSVTGAENSTNGSPWPTLEIPCMLRRKSTNRMTLVPALTMTTTDNTRSLWLRHTGWPLTLNFRVRPWFGHCVAETVTVVGFHSNGPNSSIYATATTTTTTTTTNNPSQNGSV